MLNLYHQQMQTELGTLTVLCDSDFIIRLLFDDDNKYNYLQNTDSWKLNGPNELTKLCCGKIQDYLKGGLTNFSVTPKFYGTEFEKKVWNGLLQIPYGSTVSYSALAELCAVKGDRAVGNAVSCNPVPIIVPCHRVIRKNGCIGGFRGGLARKMILLNIEGISFNNGKAQGMKHF